MKKTITLDKLNINDKAKVINIDKNCLLKRRFEDLGVVKNTIIKCEFKSMFDDPIAYLIKGSIISIRKKDSKYIKVIKI